MSVVTWLLGLGVSAVKPHVTPETDIGNVLITMGLIDEKTLEKAAAQQVARPAPRQRLGEILVDMGYITKDQLENALHAQKLMRTGRPGEAMLGIVEQRTNAMHRSMVTPPEGMRLAGVARGKS